MGTLAINLLLNITQFLRNARLATTNLAGFNRFVEKSASFLTTGFGAALGALGAGLVGFVALLKRAIPLITEFQQSMAMVATIIKSDISDALGGLPEEMRRFTKEVLTSSFAFGEATTTVARGLYNILSAAFPTKDAMIILNNSLRAARAGFTTTDVAANALITVLLSYKLRVTESAKVSDLLFETVRRGVTTFEELAPVLGRVTSTAAIAGVSLEELLATISTLTRAGLQTSLAVTSINQTIKTFLTPTKEARLRAAELGLSLDSTTLSTEGLLGTMEKLKDLLPDEVASLFREIRALRGVSASIQQLAGYHEDYNILLSSSGATQQAFILATNSMKFRVDKLRESGKVLLIEFFLPLAPIIQKMLDVVIALNTGFHTLSDSVKKNVAIWGALTAAITALAIPIALIIKFFGVGAIIAFGKFILIAAAVSAALLAIYKIGKIVVEWGKSFIDWIGNVASNISTNLSPSFDSFIEVLDTARNGLILAFPAFRALDMVVSKLIEGVGWLATKIKEWINLGIDKAKTSLKSLTEQTYDLDEAAKQLPEDIVALTQALDNATTPTDDLMRKWRAVIDNFERGVPISADAATAMNGLLKSLNDNRQVTDQNKAAVIGFFRSLITQTQLLDDTIARLKLTTEISDKYRAELDAVLQSSGSLERATGKTREELLAMFVTLRQGITFKEEARRQADALTKAFIKQRDEALKLDSAFEVLGADSPKKLRALALAGVTAFADIQKLGGFTAKELETIWIKDVLPKIIDAYGTIPPQFAAINKQVLKETAEATSAALVLDMPIKNQAVKRVTDQFQAMAVLFKASGGQLNAALSETWEQLLQDAENTFGNQFPEIVRKTIAQISGMPVELALAYKKLNQETSINLRRTVDEAVAAFHLIEASGTVPPERLRELWENVSKTVTNVYGTDIPQAIVDTNTRIIESQKAVELAEKLITKETLDGIKAKFAAQRNLLKLLTDEVKLKAALSALNKAEADAIANFLDEERQTRDNAFQKRFVRIQQEQDLTRLQRRKALKELQEDMKQAGEIQSRTFRDVGQAIDSTFWKLGNTSFRIVADAFRESVRNFAEGMTNFILGSGQAARVTEEGIASFASKTNQSIAQVRKNIEDFARQSNLSFDQAAMKLGIVEKRTYSLARAFKDLGRSIIQTLTQVLISKAAEQLANLLWDLGAAAFGGKKKETSNDPLGGFLSNVVKFAPLLLAADGGMVKSPTLVLAGEKNKGKTAASEVILPLDNPEVMTKLRNALGVTSQPSVVFNDNLNMAGAIVMMDDKAAVDRMYRNVWLPAKRRYANRVGQTLRVGTGNEPLTPID